MRRGAGHARVGSGRRSVSAEFALVSRELGVRRERERRGTPSVTGRTRPSPGNRPKSATIAAACSLLYQRIVMARTTSRLAFPSPRSPRSPLSPLFAALLVAGLAQGCVIRETNDADYPVAEGEQTEETAEAEETFDAEALPEDDETAIVTFRPVLEPHGYWVDDPSYGSVWVPNRAIVGVGFQPYVTGGHWATTDEGYYWVSDWDWGWAPFHYGRWVFTGSYGWAWIPGAQYSPAWVEWRYGNGYMGWAPARPVHHWRGGHAVAWNGGYEPGYVYTQHDHFFEREPSLHVVAGSAQPSLNASTQPYAPVARQPGSPRGFQGPDPKAVGFAPEKVSAARTSPTANERPGAIAWKPTGASKVPDPAKPAAPGNRRAPGGTPTGLGNNGNTNPGNTNPGAPSGNRTPVGRTTPTTQPNVQPRRLDPAPSQPRKPDFVGPRYQPGPVTAPRATPAPVARPVVKPTTPAPVARPRKK